MDKYVFYLACCSYIHLILAFPVTGCSTNQKNIFFKSTWLISLYIVP